MTEYKARPAAVSFRMLPDEGLKRLTDGIAINGQREPIVLYADQVLGGRNRL